ncbi:MAG: universal stress protein [Deltaproteobacteria bacterium]|nr:universal stress protein [Deltaproteobacteria bacterium]
MKQLKSILVAIDFSSNSHKALKSAELLGKKLNAALHLIHVAETGEQFVASPVFMYSDTDYVEDFLKKYTKNLNKKMEKLVQKTKKETKLQINGRVLDGKAHEMILKEAKKVKADMIVMGTHGHSGLDHLLMGSTAERVLRKATCPVLTVKNK